MPIVTFRRPAPAVPSSDLETQGREFAYAVLVPALAAANLLLGLAILVLGHHESGWKAAVLVLLGGVLCAIGGWLGGVSWLRLYWRSRMERQMRLWVGVVDTVTGWETEVGVSSESALKLKRRLDGLMSKF
ncbi:MAG: hypothetical protein ACREOV_03500 [Candidatus Dormibacteraceae bacterium]